MSEKLTRFEKQYLDASAAGRPQRLRWFREARYGMFIHWGLYSVLGRHEWAMAHERPPLAEYEALADRWQPKPNAAREWARLARRAGMKYMVMTTKHHEGFLLWDSKMSDYNAASRGPKRDLVREFVTACRAEGLRVGLYYSLMDWHHPDGGRCATDPEARKRFLAYTQGCVRELCSNYGKIDILWYDVASPLATARDWDSYRLNAMVRELQPNILINNRSKIDEDFSTPEGVDAKADDRAWEACMPTNSAWGYQPTHPQDWLSARSLLNILRSITSSQGNLLLNIGPMADGTVPPIVDEQFTTMGKWLAKYGDIIYGAVDSGKQLAWHPVGQWTRRGKKAYFWIFRWPGREFAIGGVTGNVRSIRFYPNGKEVQFKQESNRLVIRGLPAKCPEKLLEVSVLEFQFKDEPKRPFPFFYEPAQA